MIPRRQSKRIVRYAVVGQGRIDQGRGMPQLINATPPSG